MKNSKYIAWALTIAGALMLWSLIAVLVHQAAITVVAMESINLNPNLAVQMLSGAKSANVAELIILVIALGLGTAIFWFPTARVKTTTTTSDSHS